MKSVPACDQRHHPSCMLVTSQLRPSSCILPPPPRLLPQVLYGGQKCICQRLDLGIQIAHPLFSPLLRPSSYILPPPSLAFVRRVELHLLAVGSWDSNIAPAPQLLSSNHFLIYSPLHLRELLYGGQNCVQFYLQAVGFWVSNISSPLQRVLFVD